MNKRITSILLCFVMVFCMLATAVPAYADPVSTCTFTVEANKSEAHRGDTIEFTVYMKQTGTLNTLEFYIGVPDGLTFVPDSGFATAGIATTLGWTSLGEYAGWEENTMQFMGMGAASYTGTDKIALMKFQCKVNEDAAYKSYTLGFFEDEENDCLTVANDSSYESKNPVVVPANFSVVVKPVAVTGVTIDETMSIKTGENKTPSFNVLPADATNKAVTFTSNNTAVASVNATTGEVTGVKKGSATITIKTTDGNFTDTCLVTVQCSHANISNKLAVTATCKAGGNEAYKECDDCGQLLNTFGVEINAIPTTGKNMSNHTGTAKWTKTATQHTKAYDCCGTVVVATEKHDWSNGKCSECEYVCTHTGGTATCKAAKVCQHCGMSYGSKNANNHTGTAKWTKTATQHTKAYDCCGTVVVATEKHDWSNGKCSECEYVCTHTGGTATCTAKAVCTECGKSYGSLNSSNHDWDTSTWTKDASGHWHACKNGCTEKNSFAAHDPDHQGGASDEHAVKCTKCLFVIHAQLNHTHVFDKEVKNSNFKAADATCMKGTTYYKSCKCGQASTTATFTDTDVAPNNHNWATTLSKDETNHWYACQNGCTEKKDSAAHAYGSDWKSDKNNHWNECACGAKTNSAAHVDDDKDYKCDTCQYNMSKPFWGGFFNPTPDENKQESANTFDSGIALYGAMALMSATGGAALVVSKKRRNK